MEATFTFAELETVNAFRYKEVDAFGRKVAIGTVSSAEMIRWMEANEAERKEAGVRLLVKSIVEVTRRAEDGTILEGKRIPIENQEHWVGIFREKDSAENGKVIAAALELNGLNRAAAMIAALKNVSRGVTPDASRTDSPSQPVE